MAERTITGGLNIKGENYIFAGDLEVTGNITIENDSLIASGNISIPSIFLSSIHVSNGDISANSISGVISITIEAGDIYCNNELSVCDIDISSGNIITNVLNACDITSDGDIEVLTISSVTSVTCRNYLISGDNVSYTIDATEDIYIFGNNNSEDLIGRDIFLCGDNNLNRYNIIASRVLKITGSIKYFTAIRCCGK